MRAAVGDLDRDGIAGRFIQQRVCIRALEKEGHQIFEHRPGPAEEHLSPADGAVRPAHGKPVFGRDVPPGDGNEASQASLACQQIVECMIQPPFRDIIADREEPAGGVVEEAHIDGFGQVAYTPGELLA